MLASVDSLTPGHHHYLMLLRKYEFSPSKQLWLQTNAEMTEYDPDSDMLNSSTVPSLPQYVLSRYGIQLMELKPNVSTFHASTFNSDGIWL